MAKPLRSKYRTFKSLKSLEDAQDRIKREYRDIEDNAIGNIFDPVKIGMDLLPTVFGFFRSRKNKRKISNPAKVNTLSLYPANPLAPVDALPGPDHAAKKKCINILNVAKNKGLGRKVVASLIRWQLIELGIWGIKKITKRKSKQ